MVEVRDSRADPRHLRVGIRPEDRGVAEARRVALGIATFAGRGLPGCGFPDLWVSPAAGSPELRAPRAEGFASRGSCSRCLRRDEALLLMAPVTNTSSGRKLRFPWFLG